MAKHRYKIINWKHYNQALVNRGSLICWIDEEAIRIKRAILLILPREGEAFWEHVHPRKLYDSNKHWRSPVAC